MERYFIIEHPIRGILKDLEETESGRIGRFSSHSSRADVHIISCYFSLTKAEEARARIRPEKIRDECDIRSSRPRGPGLHDHWPVVA